MEESQWITQMFRIINATTGEPVAGLPGFTTFSAARREMQHKLTKERVGIWDYISSVYGFPLAVGKF